MSTADVPSSNLWIADGVPLRLISWTETSTGSTITYDLDSLLPSTALILGCDITAVNAQPVQCWVGLQIPVGVYVYWDSQSTGEGLGVRFPWRGQVPLAAGEDLAVYFHSSATIEWSVTVWGLAVPYGLAVGSSS